MLTIQRTRKNNSKSNAGFIIADFLFAFVLVIGVGIIIFAFTFSLATIEITQYIVWSTARNYAASSVTEVDANKSAKEKFKNLRKQFPMLATQGGAGWFELSDVTVGDLAKV
ncbi:MAG: hypothetical protein H7061_01485, partial [Bdellovibrionaceae bacterium]|nr:hypothetical protein [Bdellovibrio sp.]